MATHPALCGGLGVLIGVAIVLAIWAFCRSRQADWLEADLFALRNKIFGRPDWMD